MGIEQPGRFNRIMQGLPQNPELPPLPPKVGEALEAYKLSQGDFCVEYDATVQFVTPVNHGRDIKITFFENKHPEVIIDRDTELDVMR